MSSKQITLGADQLEKLRKISYCSSKAHKNNLRLTQAPEASTYKELAQDYKKKKLALEVALEDLKILEEERKLVEGELGVFESSLRVSKDRLAHAKGNEFRALPLLHLEISSLETKVSEYSDVALDLIERIEVQAASISALESDVKATLASAMKAKESVEAMRTDVAKNDALLQRDIAEVKKDLDPALLDLLNRVPNQIIDKVAHVIEQSCSGCRLRLSASLSDQIRRFGNEAHYCEECGRLLLPQPAI